MMRFLERARQRRSIVEELEAYLEEKVADLVESGVPEAEARLRARREFGNAALIAEESRRALGWVWLESLAQDLRYAFRVLLRNPAFSVVAVLSLALGIGANTAIFGLLDTIAWRMLPVRDPQSLWAVGLTESGAKSDLAHSYPLYTIWHEHNRSFDTLAAAGSFTWRDKSAGSNQALHEGQFVSGNYFDTLGVPALIGRTIAPADDSIEGAGGPQGAVVMLGNHYWTRTFQRDPAILGRKVNVNGAWLTVIGVTPPEFFGIQVGRSPDVFVPMQVEPVVLPTENLLHNVRNSETTWVTVLGRLRVGVSQAQAKTDLTPLYGQYAITRMDPASQFAYLAGKLPLAQKVELEPASRGFSRLREQFSEPLRVLMALVAIVLLIACANVANLLLARAKARQKEIAVRLAIGAGRRRLLRQLLAESLVLSLSGGLLGLVFALWGSHLLIGMLPQGPTPLVLSVDPDLRILGFTFGVSVFTGLLFGLAPALRATDLRLSGTLHCRRSHGGRLGWLDPGKAIVVIEVALSVQLLVGAGLFIRTLRNLTTLDAGFIRQNVLQLRMNVDAARYTRQQWGSVYEAIMARVSAVPGVAAVSLADRGLIENGITRSGPVHYPGYTFQPGESRQLPETGIGPEYFRAAGIPLRRGRFFTERDGSAKVQVAIVNEEMARRYFAGRNPIGQRFGLGDDPDNIEIVGVVADAKYTSLRQEAMPMAYSPWKQVMPRRLSALVVRTGRDAAEVAAALRQALAAVHPDLFVEVRTLSSQIDQSLVRERLLARLSGFFGLLAMLLACIGLYGVVAYGVSRRTAEIGVRMALGAVRGDVILMVLRESMLLAVSGIVIGAPVALWLTGLTRTLLFGLTPGDPTVLAVAVFSLLAVCALAGWLPARRAARVDPMAALRYE